jgi:hypothetical protein
MWQFKPTRHHHWRVSSRRTIGAVVLLVVAGCSTAPAGPSPSGPTPSPNVASSAQAPTPSFLASLSPPPSVTAEAAAFCSFVATFHSGTALANPLIPLAFQEVMEGGSPTEALRISRDLLLPAVASLRRDLETMRQSGRGAQFVARAETLIAAFEKAVMAFVAAPSPTTAKTVDETGRVMDIGVFADTHFTVVGAENFGTECL